MTTAMDGRAGRWFSAGTSPFVLALTTAPVVMVFGLVAATDTVGAYGPTQWWPAAAPASVLVALAARDPSAPRRFLPSASRVLPLLGVLLAVGAGSLAARLLVGHGPDLALVRATGDVVHAGVTGLILASGAGLCLRTMTDLGRLMAAASVGAVAAGGIAFPAGLPAVEFWMTTMSRGSAVLLLVPLVVRLPRRAARVPVAETVAAWVLLVGALALALKPPGTAPVTFLAVAVLVVTALRLSVRSSVAQVAFAGALVAVATAHGAGPFAALGQVGGPLCAQLFLVVSSVTVLLVALTVAARDAELEAAAARDGFRSAVLDAVGAGVLACDVDGRIVLRNAAYRRVVDVDASGTGPANVHEWGLVDRVVSGTVADTVGPPPEARPPREVVADARPVRAPDGRLLGVAATFTDVTDERAVQDRLREAVGFHDAVLAASPDVIFIVDVATHRVVWASGTVEPTLGYTPEQIVDLDRVHRLNVVHPEDLEALRAADDEAARMDDGEVQTLRLRMTGERGDPRWMSRRVTPFTRAADGRVVQLLGVARDVTDVVEVEQRLTDAANRDPLTGLLNRRALLDRLGTLVERADTGAAAPTTVLFCDLDGFKEVNDSLGHAAGDLLLVTVAQRITGALRDEDLLARAGGDEFVLLLEPRPARFGLTATDALYRARTVARRVLETVSRPIEVHGVRLTVTLSIGIALVRPGIGPGEVLRDADAAMYRAKSTGKNRLHVFEVAPERN